LRLPPLIGSGSKCRMDLAGLLRLGIKAARKRGAPWVRVLDVVRLFPTVEGRAQLWTRAIHGAEVHQTSMDTSEDRYPELFELAAQLVPDAKRILSFGCSTGEELLALRQRFPQAEIVGAEINSRSRRIATGKIIHDPAIEVVPPRSIEGSFDAVFALAVLQREPTKMAEMRVEDLTPFYPFERFDKAVGALVARLHPGGLLCVMHAQYPVEASAAASRLKPLDVSPLMEQPIFGADGRRMPDAEARTIFRKI
jgi:hypothetical protein